jgi:phospholipid/cholesterol/gamma-HCH transport system ATP-binding protein
VNDLLPAALSGGMRKRAALARALITAPDILLCDEPFSGLDPATLRLVESLLMDTNRRLGVTMIISSHDVGSTFRMADHVVLLVDGVAIAGTPDEFRRNRDPRVEEFFAGELR